MKLLTIMRHAKSSWDMPGDDFDRPLNDRGRKAAKAVGKALKSRIEFDAILASPAVRVRETLERLEPGYGALPRIRFEPALYLADVPALLAHVRLLSDDYRKVLLVGHNPGLQGFVLELARDDAADRAEVQAKFPTAAAAILEVPVERWDDLRPGASEIAGLIRPRDLD